MVIDQGLRRREINLRQHIKEMSPEDSLAASIQVDKGDTEEWTK